MTRFSSLVVFLLAVASAPSLAQTYTDLASYCYDMSEVSTTTLLARTRGIPRSQVEAMMRRMTNPLAIRMVKEVIDFAYSRPASIGLDELRAELRNLCLAKKIFVHGTPISALATNSLLFRSCGSGVRSKKLQRCHLSLGHRQRGMHQACPGCSDGPMLLKKVS